MQIKSLAIALLAALFAFNAARAEESRVLPAGKLPQDARLGKLKDLNGYFPLEVPDSREAWAARSAAVRRQLLVANGLWPMPEPTPLKAVVHGPVDREGYTVEKVILESYPGHYVTGNLYRPKGVTGPLPAVLCPHGHWPGGRFHDHGESRIRQEIVNGAERFESGGRHPLQARCVQLARMGCLVFHYDMLGYADSVQISFELAHRFAKQRPELDDPQRFGFFSTQAELRMQSVMGLQTYNSIRALDWICSLPEVDAKRIAVTGASGGGTQTFMLCAVDPRPAVAFPAVMVSTAMQGGCTCENATLLRVGTGNIEIAGLIAPRPLGMTAADDWTVEIATKGLPELKQLYTMLGAPENVMARPLVHFKHNYNYVSRAAMYSWLNKHLKLGLAEPVVEEDYQPLSVEEMSVWNESYPKPQGGDAYEVSLTKYLAESSDEQIAALKPSDAASLAAYRRVVGGAFDSILGRGLPRASDIEREKVDKQDHGDYFLFKDLLRYKPGGEEIPVVFLHPKQWNKQVVLWVDGQGKAGLFGNDGAPRAEVRKLLAAGHAVAAADLLYQGEFLADGKPLELAPTVGNPREFAGYSLGYNSAVFARRVHDILTLAAFVHGDEHKPDSITLLGTGEGGVLAAAASAQAGDAVGRVAIDTEGFRFARLKSYRDVNFLPGAVKYGDVPGLVSLAAPKAMFLAGEGEQAPAIVAACYQAGGSPKAITLHQGKPDAALSAAVEWIIR